MNRIARLAVLVLAPCAVTCSGEHSIGAPQISDLQGFPMAEHTGPDLRGQLSIDIEVGYNKGSVRHELACVAGVSPGVELTTCDGLVALTMDCRLPAHGGWCIRVDDEWSCAPLDEEITVDAAAGATARVSVNDLIRAPVH